MKVYQANCDQFDNCCTGYYATPEEAIEALWAENVWTPREKARVVPWTRAADSEDPETLESARNLADGGSPSPVLGIKL